MGEILWTYSHYIRSYHVLVFTIIIVVIILAEFDEMEMKKKLDHYYYYYHILQDDRIFLDEYTNKWNHNEDNASTF